MLNVNARLFAAVGLARSYEETRYYLNGIFVTKDYMVATDGHILTAARMQEEEYQGDAAIIPASRKAITAAKGKKALLVQWDGSTLCILDNKGITAYMEKAPPINGTFPDWKRIVPNDYKGLAPSPAAWSGEVSGTLSETARLMGEFSYGGGFTLRAPEGDPSKAHLVRYDTSLDIFSVAMPRRYTWNAEEIPAWAKGK